MTAQHEIKERVVDMTVVFLDCCDLSFGKGLSTALFDVFLRDYLISLKGWLAVALQERLTYELSVFVFVFIINDWLTNKLNVLLSNLSLV